VSDPLPLCLSERIIRALERAGFARSRRSKDSRLTLTRRTQERTYVTVVPLAKREVPRGTLRSILELAGLSVEEFRRILR
jgi:predicted RNA binding protein YcfA (HicA-like mRNA interferase family)